MPVYSCVNKRLFLFQCISDPNLVRWIKLILVGIFILIPCQTSAQPIRPTTNYDNIMTSQLFSQSSSVSPTTTTPLGTNDGIRPPTTLMEDGLEPLSSANSSSASLPINPSSEVRQWQQPTSFAPVGSARRVTTTTTAATTNTATSAATTTTRTTTSASSPFNIHLTTTNVQSTASPPQETVNFLTLIAVVALVMIIFITCLLVATVCPPSTCSCFEPLSDKRCTESTSYDVQQQPSRPPSPPQQPLPQSLPAQQTPLSKEKRVSSISSNSNFNYNDHKGAPVDGSLDTLSSQSNDVINFCCLAFHTGSAKQDTRNIAGLNLVENTPEVKNMNDDSVVEKYRKLTRCPSDLTIKGEEQSSSGTERVAVIESDSDNLAKELCPQNYNTNNNNKDRSNVRLLRAKVKRRRSSESDFKTARPKASGVNRSRIKGRTYPIDNVLSPRHEYFISQCPYCSCNNLMVTNNEQPVDQPTSNYRSRDEDPRNVQHSAL